MPPRSPVRAIALVTACVALLTSCTGDDDQAPDDAASAPEPLAPVWTATPPGEGTYAGTMRPLGDGDVLYARQDRLVAFDAESGRRLWSRRVADMCRIGKPNAEGDVVLTLGGECRDVAVLDGDTGKRRWRTHIPTVSKYDSGDVIATVGDRTVTVVQFCGQVTRLSLRDGHRLGVLAPHDRACANEADSDGQLIALWHDPATAATPDGNGTGWIPSWNGTGTFELYDADSGRRLWRRETNRKGAGLFAGAVVSSDTAILALKEHEHTTMRRYSRTTPKPGAYVGRQLERYNGAFRPVGNAGGVLVGSYGSPTAARHRARIFAYDLDTGRELWSRAYPREATGLPRVAGADRHGLVLAQPGSESDAGGAAQSGTWVTRWDLRTGENAGAAWIAHDDPSSAPQSWAVVDGTLFGLGQKIRAYDLAALDPALSPPGSTVDWAENDVRADPFAEPCTAVQPATLRQLGLRRSVALPTPANCVWIEHNQPDSSDRGLDVNVTVAEPGPLALGGTGAEERTAVENAQAILEQRLKGFNPGVTSTATSAPMPKPVPLDGVGDEAYATSGAAFWASSGSVAGSYLLVRERNVIVEIEAEGRYDLAYRGAGQPSLHRSEAGVITAAEDVFQRMGLRLEVPPTPPDDGRFGRVRGVCNALRDDAAALGLPAPRSVMPAGSGPRAAECAWWQGEGGAGDLAVHAYAAAGSALTGRTGRQVATGLFAASTDDTEPLERLGDRATISRDDDTEAADGYDHSRRVVTTRVGNLVVQVAYSRWGAGLGDQVERDAIRLTREALRAAS